MPRASLGIAMRTAAAAVVGVAQQSTTLGRAASAALHGCCKTWQGRRWAAAAAAMSRRLRSAGAVRGGEGGCQIRDARVVRAAMGMAIWDTPEGSPSSWVFPYVPPPPIVWWSAASWTTSPTARVS